MAAACTLVAGFSLRPAPAAVTPGRWVPGDLHVRTTYSGDTCRVTTSGLECDDDANGTDASPASIGVGAIDRVKEAEQRGLAFIAITDLDSPSSASSPSAQNDPEIDAYKACHDAPPTPGQCPVLILDGIEKSLLMHPGSVPGGHALAVGYSGPFPTDPTPSTAWTTTDFTNSVNGALKKIHDAGGLFLAEGPGNPSWKFSLSSIPVDGYDVWRGLYADQTELTGAAAADNPQADAKWRTAVTGLAAVGKKLTAFGGSGASLLATGSIEGPGQPSVWVYDTFDAPTDPVTWNGVRQAILAGRVIVSSALPSQAGPLLWLEAVDASNTVSYIAGDSVPGSSKVRVAWSGAPIGATIRIMGVSFMNGPVQERGTRILVESPSGTGANALFSFPKGAWYRAEMYLEDDTTSPRSPVPGRDTNGCVAGSCFQDRYAMLALSGTLYGL